MPTKSSDEADPVGILEHSFGLVAGSTYGIGTSTTSAVNFDTVFMLFSVKSKLEFSCWHSIKTMSKVGEPRLLWRRLGHWNSGEVGTQSLPGTGRCFIVMDRCLFAAAFNSLSFL